MEAEEWIRYGVCGSSYSHVWDVHDQELDDHFLYAEGLRHVKIVAAGV